MKFSIRYLLFILCLCLCLFSGWKFYGIYVEYRQGEESYEDLANQFVAPIPQEGLSPAPGSAASSETWVTEPISEETKPNEKTAPITVDFDALLAECPDVVGWIYCPDTPINYPIVQARDNVYYIDRLMDGTYNSSGSIFLDYRCTSDFSGWNNIIYGHNMKNDSMFGTLEEYKKQEYYDAHPVLYLLTPMQDYKIELIGGYTTFYTDNITYAFPDTQAGCDGLIAKAREQSTFQTEVAVSDNDRLITLSTCAYDYDGARYVLLGLLKPLT